MRVGDQDEPGIQSLLKVVRRNLVRCYNSSSEESHTVNKILTDFASMYARSNSLSVGPSAGLAMWTAKGMMPATS